MTTLIRVCGIVLVAGVFQQVGRGGEAPPPIEEVEIRANRAFDVNGRPFFPLTAWLQDAENFPAVTACGMNTTAGYWPASGGTKDVAEYLKLVADADLYAVVPFDPRPVFLTLTGNFHPHFGKWTDDQRATLYPAYIEASDVVGYDIYPIYGWNKPEWIHLVHDATKLLVEKAGPRPVYAWIETSKGGQWTGPLERQKDVTPAHIRAEAWMAITGGATAIGYFTHVWKPSYRQFGVPEENRKALREINDQITRLAPAILAEEPGRSVAVEAEGGVKVGAMAKRHGSQLYVFAVNYDERLIKAETRFTVEGLPAGAKVTVIDEERTIRSDAGSFSDTFEPLAVHIYRIDTE